MFPHSRVKHGFFFLRLQKCVCLCVSIHYLKPATDVKRIFNFTGNNMYYDKFALFLPFVNINFRE